MEKEIVQKFIQIAEKNKCDYFTGQVLKNRIIIKSKVHFQFGDFRIDTNEHHLVVELESSSSGVTNLVKYWYCLTDKQIKSGGIIKKPIYLFHIFKPTTENDYFSHQLLWELIWQNMQKKIGHKILAKRYTYKQINELENIICEFENILKNDLNNEKNN